MVRMMALKEEQQMMERDGESTVREDHADARWEARKDELRRLILEERLRRAAG